MPKNGVPDRWEDYSKIGDRMDSDEISTRFISFKVPLKQTITRFLPEKERFGPQDLLSMCEKKGFKLGLIIDLTFTKRYYEPSAFTEQGVKYEKIPIEGEMVPKKARVEKFREIVQKFLKDPDNGDKLVGVHCTHGINRTGYSICKYLIDNEGADPDEVIKLFDSCRGHGIERESYLRHLRTGKLPDSEKNSYNDGSYTARHWSNKSKQNQDDTQNYGDTRSQHGNRRKRRHQDYNQVDYRQNDWYSGSDRYANPPRHGGYERNYNQGGYGYNNTTQGGNNYTRNYYEDNYDDASYYQGASMFSGVAGYSQAHQFSQMPNPYAGHQRSHPGYGNQSYGSHTNSRQDSRYPKHFKR